MAETVRYYYSDKNAKDQKQIVRILRNMADALESNAVPDLDTGANNPIGELSVDLMAEAGQAWIGEPDSWAVFELSSRSTPNKHSSGTRDNHFP